MTSRAADTLDRRKLRTIDIDGIATRYYDDGEGETLVLVHGGEFGADYSLDSWSLNLRDLAPSFRVIAFDRLGQGHTDNPRDDSGYTVEAVVEHARAFLAALTSGPVHLVGHSRGGLVASRLAIDHPQRVRTLTIVDSNTTAPEDPEFPSEAFYQELEERLPTGPPSLAGVRVEPEAQCYFRASVTDDFVARMLEIANLPKRQEGLRRMKRVGATVWRSSLERKRRETLELIDLRGVAVPTLVLWGREDPSAPLPLALRLFDRIAPLTRDAQLHVLGRAGHYSFRDQPESFGRTLRAFCIR